MQCKKNELNTCKKTNNLNGLKRIEYFEYVLLTERSTF